MKRKIIPGVIDGKQLLCCLGLEDTAQAAAATMRERGIGAVLVTEGGRLVGIVTERDLVFRVLAGGRDPASATLREVMTPDPETLRPDDSAFDALEKMRLGKYRHLPVVEGDELRGMVSIRDLYEWIRRTLEEDLHSAQTLIYGEQYGAASA
ncbi:MAG: CBS domain-containing protein [Geminicoccaceae bacterium]